MDDALRDLLLSVRHGLVHADSVRRARGRWLDVIGFGPMETPSRVVQRWPGAELRAYDDTGSALAPSSSAAVLLIIPAPIKQAYVWDLSPAVSVVRRALEVGLQVYLIRWMEPERDTPEHDFGLADYADSFIARSLDAIAADSADRVAIPAVLAGHSLGGTLAAIFAALHPEEVRALVLLEAPVRFPGLAAGVFAPLVRLAPPADVVAAALGGHVPGSFLNLVSLAAAPDVFHWELWQDAAISLTDPSVLRLHLQVERWTLDEFPLPGRLFAEVVEHLYREDRFSRGILRIRGQLAAPANIAAPVLAVYNPRSRVVPPSSIVPFIEALAAKVVTQALCYEGDTGVALQHVGVLVGRNAHRQLWPAILDWIRQHC